MRILVASASKHGATAGIAEAIADALTWCGFDVTNERVDEATDLDAYDGFVIGSAIYAGHWMKQATRFVEANAEALSTKPVWLFSSGPLGDPPAPPGDPAGAAPMITATRAREHRVFSGSLERGALNLAERAVVKAVKAPYGDFRDWDEVRLWAEHIAAAMLQPVS